MRRLVQQMLQDLEDSLERQRASRRRIKDPSRRRRRLRQPPEGAPARIGGIGSLASPGSITERVFKRVPRWHDVSRGWRSTIVALVVADEPSATPN